MYCSHYSTVLLLLGGKSTVAVTRDKREHSTVPKGQSRNQATSPYCFLAPVRLSLVSTLIRRLLGYHSDHSCMQSSACDRRPRQVPLLTLVDVSTLNFLILICSSAVVSALCSTSRKTLQFVRHLRNRFCMQKRQPRFPSPARVRGGQLSRYPQSGSKYL